MAKALLRYRRCRKHGLTRDSMRLLYRIRYRLRSLVRRRELEIDLNEELRFHIHRQVAANIAAGMMPDAARRAALLELAAQH